MNKEDEYSFTINSEGKKYTFQGMYAGTIDSSWWRWQFTMAVYSILLLMHQCVTV